MASRHRNKFLEEIEREKVNEHHDYDNNEDEKAEIRCQILSY